ncbi:thioredoxin family protein [Radiobacillus sp. PE A8.2]|uniref:thioredoxin family protein n=1 Tax=Radiobacillus sp. PE A8.2 TaxID=3380349 RepID=UPI00388D58F6
MIQITKHALDFCLRKDIAFIFIHTPFCGTCKLARKMLVTVEEMWEQDIFYDLNAAMFPDKMKQFQITSVPCLLILRKGKPVDKIYAIESVTNIYNQLLVYKDQI